MKQKQHFKNRALAAVLLLLVSIIPQLAGAHDIVVAGIYYNINGNEATVTYKGNSSGSYDEYTGSVNIPSSVTYNGTTYSVTRIGDDAFRYSSLTSVTIPNSVTGIGNEAFFGCSGLTSMVVESGNTAYDSRNNCNAIIKTATNTLISGCKNTVIPNSVTSIGDRAFSSCTGLTSIFCNIPNPLPIDDDVFSNYNADLFVPSTSVNAYQSEYPWSKFSVHSFDDVLATGISLNKTSTSLTVGATETLVATVTPSNTTNKTVSWKSSNTSVATVDQTGKVTAKAVGTANITATTTDGTNLSATCKVTVTPATVLATGISLNKTSTSLTVGATETLVATVTPSNTTNKTVSWKSSNTSVATVDNSGKVTAKAEGTANITATTTDGTNLTATCQVTVTPEAQTEEYTITIGNGTVANEGVPIVNWQMGSYIGSECLYLKDQLTGLKAGDKITSISFYLMSGSAKGGNFNVRMKNTSISTLKNNANTYDTSCIEVNYNDQVNGNVTLGPYSGGQWIYFPLSTPFVYNGENIIIDIRNTTPGTRAGWCYFATTTYNGRRSLAWHHANSENPHVDGFNDGGIYDYENSTDLPNIKIAYTSGNVYATGISLNKTSTSLTVGATESLVATVTPSNATNKTVSWESSNTSVATVDQNGKVTAKAAGTANITATTTDGSNLSATCKVTVTSSTVLATGISFNKPSMSLAVGNTETLVATVTPSNATNKNVTWSSSNTSVATVDQNGKVTAKTVGTANITATTTDGTNLTATCQVTVISPPSIVENTITIGNGTVQDETVPIYNWQMGSYVGSECLYVKDQLADLKAGDKITSIAFYLVSGNAKGGNFNVRMKNTSISSLKNNADAHDTSCIEVNYNDQVNGNVTLEPYSGGQWINFPLSTPFVYNGENIIVDIRNTTPGTRSGWCYFATTTYNGVRRSLVWNIANSEDPHADGFNSGGIFGYNNTSNLPNIKITYLTNNYVIPGDVNGDGHVSSVDVTALYNYLLNGDDSNLVNGDVDGDGHISSVDVTAVYNVLLGN